MIIDQYEFQINIIFIIIVIYSLYQQKYIYISIINILKPLFQIIIEYYYKWKFKSKKRTEYNENNEIYDVSVFPSGNIILLTINKIKILNNNFDILQEIYTNSYLSVDLKDENIFLITSKIKKKLKIYRKQKNLYIFDQVKDNLKGLNFAQFFARKEIIAVCDNNICIFKDKNTKYELIINIKEDCKSILFIKSKNILVTTSNNSTKFRNLKTYEITKIFGDITSEVLKNGIANIDNERIIILSIDNSYNAIVLSISKKQIIKYIKLNSKPLMIHVMEKKDFFFIHMEYLLIAYKNNNYKYFDSPTLKNKAHNLYGFCRLKKIMGINDEIYLALEYSKLSIYKY